MTFNIVAVLFVIAPDKQHLGFTRRGVLAGAGAPPPPAAWRFVFRQIRQHKLADILHHWPLDTHRIVLLGLRAVVDHMFGGVVDPTDKGDAIVDQHDLAVHPAKQVGAHPENLRARVVIAENDSRRGQFRNKLIAEIRRTVAVEQHFHADAALRRRQHRLVQLAAHVILEPDKGFYINFVLCFIDGAKYGGEKHIAVFQ